MLPFKVFRGNDLSRTNRRMITVTKERRKGWATVGKGGDGVKIFSPTFLVTMHLESLPEMAGGENYVSQSVLHLQAGLGPGGVA